MPIPKSQKAKPRNWGGDLLNKIMSDKPSIEGGLIGSLAAITNLIGMGADVINPRTVPQDVELPNPGGWSTMDPRLKEYHLGFLPDGPLPGQKPKR